MKKAIFLIIISLLYTWKTYSQITVSDYVRADSAEKWRDMVYNSNISAEWIDKTSYFWYQTRTRQGKEYFLVNANFQIKREAFDHVKLCNKLNALTRFGYKPFNLNLKNVKFTSDLKEMTFDLEGLRYHLVFENYELKVKGEVPKGKKERHWGETDDEWKGEPVISPDSIWEAYIKNFNVYVKKRKTRQEIQLSFDGSEGEHYSAGIIWSPNSKYLATHKVRATVKKYIQFVESSPATQLQPILRSIEYLKPGDALPIRKPSLFDIQQMVQIPVNTEPFENQYNLDNLKWWNDSRAFTFEYNQRGHQVYQVVEVDAKTGKTKIIINETSNTFIDYSSKRYRYDVNDGKEIIWALERDGWNHLYLFDGTTGKIKSQITKGEWVVREVITVNDSTRTVIFKGSGKNKGEDPYFIHYYKVKLDGTELIDLTPEPANHEATFSHNFKYMVDNYSRVDVPSTTVLRNTDDGTIQMQIEKADITELLKKGWKAPEAFVAKGRDGKTDIWGNIYRPTNFDPSKSYPIVEYIYAGPHSSFVQKSFSPYISSFAGLTELGFIVVQIDGMGTSNRSKAFHDVCWKNLKDAGFPDRILWIKEAADKYPYMDTTRVGIYGGSAGGQSAMAALLFHPDFYKAAVAACGCHDNRMDKIWWNEQFMGYPIGPQYEACSNVENAYKLKGRLMLILGEIDDNVDPASTMQVADALIKAKKDFELVVLPGVNHTLGGKYGERKRRDFFIKYLLNQEPPKWNEQ